MQILLWEINVNDYFKLLLKLIILEYVIKNYIKMPHPHNYRCYL